MAEWYYAQGGQQFGPLGDQDLVNLIRQGTVQPSDLVWRDGMADWQEAGRVPELAGALPQQPQPQYPAPQYQQPQYQQPQYQQPQPTRAPVGYYNAQSNRHGSPPPTYLVQSILCTIFCCIPFGIVAIVMAAQVNSRYQSGDYAGAVEKSEAAKKWCWVAFICGLVVGALNAFRVFAEMR